MKFVLKDTDEWFGAIFSTALYGGVAGLVLFFVLLFAGGERVGSASNALFEATRAEPLLLWISGAGIAFLFTQKCRDWVFPAEAALQAEQRANERAQLLLASESKRLELVAKEKASKDAFARTMAEIRQKELAESARLEAMQLELDGWKAMSPFQFEEQVAVMFRRLGAEAKVTPKSRDGGVDIELTLDGQRFAVQCKRFNQGQVGRPDCQALLGAVISGRYTGGMIVSTVQPSAPAMTFCKENGIGVVSGANLVHLATQGAPANLGSVLLASRRH